MLLKLRHDSAGRRTRAPAGLAPVGVTCRNLTRRFRSVVALDGVTLEMRPGTVHALVGENGAGKSTLLGILAGRISPTSGEVMINGRALRTGDPRSSRAAG